MLLDDKKAYNMENLQQYIVQRCDQSKALSEQMQR